MTFRKLFFRCECGRSPARVQDVGVTAEHELVIRWWCTVCKRRVFIVKSLSDCWRACPGQSGDSEQAIEAGDPNTSDVQFLRSLGVCFPEEVDT
jgi:hypothetical protein